MTFDLQLKERSNKSKLFQRGGANQDGRLGRKPEHVHNKAQVREKVSVSYLPAAAPNVHTNNS